MTTVAAAGETFSLTNKRGESALHYACNINRNQLHFPEEDRQIARLLLESGADKELKATDGATALSLAERGGHSAVVALLA